MTADRWVRLRVVAKVASTVTLKAVASESGWVERSGNLWERQLAESMAAQRAHWKAAKWDVSKDFRKVAWLDSGRAGLSASQWAAPRANCWAVRRVAGLAASMVAAWDWKLAVLMAGRWDFR